MGMEMEQPPSHVIFEIIENAEFSKLEDVDPNLLRPFLPLLLRFALGGQGTVDNVDFGLQEQSLLVFRLLSRLEKTNAIWELFQVDFAPIDTDVRKELLLRQKIGSREQESILIQNLNLSLSLEYERGDPPRKLRLIMSELLFIMSQIHEIRTTYYMKNSDLFDNWVYMEDVCGIICVALFELPNLLSLCDVCEALLHVKNGPQLIVRIVANFPDLFSEVCFFLISNGDKCEEESDGGLIRLEALRLLCTMCPLQSLVVRSKCVESCKMPALTLYLSLENEKLNSNLVSFLTGMLLGNDQQIRNWFSTYIKNSQKKKGDNNSLLRLRASIFSFVKNILSRANGKKLSDHDVVQSSSLLRLFVAMKGIAGFKFNDEEILDLLSLITLKAPSSPPGCRFVVLGLCSLIACPSLLSMAEHEKHIVEWIKFLIKDEAISSSDGANSSFGEILLLMAIHFHSNQLNAISELVCTTLGMKIAIRVNTMSKIKQIFTQEIFTEQVVTTHAVKVPVIPRLNGDLTGFLPVHCIYQLIKSRAFTKHKVSIKDWIYRQILASTFPIHPVLPNLLEVYVQSILVPSTSTVGSTRVVLELTNEPLTEDEILDVFKDIHSKSNLAPQLLLLYYTLFYEDNRLNNLRNLVHTGKKVKSYSIKLFSKMPVKYLIKKAEKRQDKCGGLFPSLLKLLTSHFPQLCLVNEWLENEMLQYEEAPYKTAVRKYKMDFKIEKDSFEKAFSNPSDHPYEANLLLNLCKVMPSHVLWEYAPQFVKQIKKIIDPSISRKIQDSYKTVWYKLNNVYPRSLWEMTTNALMSDGSLYLSSSELIAEPIHILRCYYKVYRCPPVLDILLHILAATLSTSKYHLSKHLQETFSPAIVPQGAIGIPDAEREKEELKNCLIAVQESAAVQILLESCLKNEDDQAAISSELTLQETRSIICSFLHQLFINDPTLAKLVHFQGYPMELIPIAVRGIPSMHICLDFVPELLTQPDIEKQIFAIQLISYISLQYSLPKSYNIAKTALTTMFSVISSVISEDRSEFFILTLSAIERFCKSFPPLTEEAVGFLIHAGKICKYQNSLQRNRINKVVSNKFFLSRIHQCYQNILKHVLLNRKMC